MRLALIFDQPFPGTTGDYLARACPALGIEADHYRLQDATRIAPEYDLYLRVDHGDDYLVRLPEPLRPAAFYAIDTHLPHSWRKIRRSAGWYDAVFSCHRAGAARLPGAEWIPVGCDPEAHAAPEAPVQWDLGFVGTDGGVPRKFYLQALRERYPNSRIGGGPAEQLGAIYGRSRIGFNYAIAGDVNMRVFEVMASGALLVTNRLPGDDLARLGLRDGQHLVTYRTPRELFRLVDHYLAHEDERRRIADAGRREVLAAHTYAHRMRQMLDSVTRRLGLAWPAAAARGVAA